MTRRRINPQLAKLHRSYSVEEIAVTFGVHKNSVRSWIKKGLPTVDKSRPILVLGSVLRKWLSARRKSAKRPCPPGTIYCLKCREPRPPALGMIEYKPINSVFGDLGALCSDCNTVMHRRTRRETIATVMPDMEVQIREGSSSISERPAPSLNCDNLKEL